MNESDQRPELNRKVKLIVFYNTFNYYPGRRTLKRISTFPDNFSFRLKTAKIPRKDPFSYSNLKVQKLK